MAATGVLSPREEYLRTTTDPDCEFVDGVIEERSVGEYDHSTWQGMIVAFFTAHQQEWGIKARPELRVQVKENSFRVPDVVILSRSAPIEQIVTVPPLAVFEILSREDSMARILKKLAEYERMGIGAIWVIEPTTRQYWIYRNSQLTPATIFELPSSAFSVSMEEIAALVD
jgi:Uma2 family endonuclease